MTPPRRPTPAPGSVGVEVHEETSDVMMPATKSEVRLIARRQEDDAREIRALIANETKQLHGRISKMGDTLSREITLVKDDVNEIKQSNAAQTGILTTLVKLGEEQRDEARTARRIELEGAAALRTETARIGRAQITSRTKIWVAFFGLLAAAIGAGVTLAVH